MKELKTYSPARHLSYRRSAFGETSSRRQAQTVMARTPVKWPSNFTGQASRHAPGRAVRAASGNRSVPVRELMVGCAVDGSDSRQRDRVNKKTPEIRIASRHGDFINVSSFASSYSIGSLRKGWHKETAFLYAARAAAALILFKPLISSVSLVLHKSYCT